MSRSRYAIGDKVVLQKHTSLWAQAHVQGRSNIVYEVTAIVDDGMGTDRITVRAEGESEASFIGIDASQFMATEHP